MSDCEGFFDDMFGIGRITFYHYGCPPDTNLNELYKIYTMFSKHHMDLNILNSYTSKQGYTENIISFEQFTVEYEKYMKQFDIPRPNKKEFQNAIKRRYPNMSAEQLERIDIINSDLFCHEENGRQQHMIRIGQLGIGWQYMFSYFNDSAWEELFKTCSFGTNHINDSQRLTLSDIAFQRPELCLLFYKRLLEQFRQFKIDEIRDFKTYDELMDYIEHVRTDEVNTDDTSLNKLPIVNEDNCEFNPISSDDYDYILELISLYYRIRMVDGDERFVIMPDDNGQHLIDKRSDLNISLSGLNLVNLELIYKYHQFKPTEPIPKTLFIDYNSRIYC